MSLTTILNPERLCIHMTASDKSSAIAELVDVAMASGIEMDREATIEQFMERESLGSTGIGLGVAVPHIRLETIDQCIVVFGNSLNGVDFNAIDDKPVHLFFMIFGPSCETRQENYLTLMATISRMLKQSDARDDLIKTGDKKTILSMIERYEA